MAQRSLVLLGSTGSIGKSTVDVIRKHPGEFAVRALAAYSNVDLLAEQCRELRPEYACVVDESKRVELTDRLAGESISVLAGEMEMLQLATLSGVDIVVNAVVGAAGLRASLETVKIGRTLALANKESMVAGGPLFPAILKETGAKILPIDSEHSAIWQALAAGKEHELERIIITASGGPFRTLAAEKFKDITKAQALDHPTWKMGPKITIDSSTLANKGLEVIEAVALFQVPVKQVAVVVHPQSIVHSMVEFRDSSIIAQLSSPDMRLPITYALFWPERAPSDYGRLDLEKLTQLTFESPDYERFPALRIAFEAAEAGETAPAVFNAANEAAVAAFLAEKIEYIEIAKLIGQAVDKIDVVRNPSLEDILETDRQARALVEQTTGFRA